MRDLFDTLFDTALWLLLWGIAIYTVLTVGTYVAYAEEALTHDEQVVALTLLGEARGEGSAGIYAVACVIQNRAAKGNKSLVQVCLADKQFSIWNNGKTTKDLKHLWGSPSAPYAIKLARAMCKGHKLVQSYTGNADHYYSSKIRKEPPYWAFIITKINGEKVKKPIKPSKVIGYHVFYKLKEN